MTPTNLVTRVHRLVAPGLMAESSSQLAVNVSPRKKKKFKRALVRRAHIFNDAFKAFMVRIDWPCALATCVVWCRLGRTAITVVSIFLAANRRP